MNTISLKSILISAFLVGTLISCGSKKEEAQEEQSIETTQAEEAQLADTQTTTDAATGELSLDKTTFTPNESIRLAFKVNQKLSSRPWIGIIPSEIPHGDESQNDQHDISYQYFDNQENGVLEFKAPLQTGKYDFRMHSSDSEGVEITSISFEVNNGTQTGTLAVGERVAAQWTNNRWYEAVITEIQGDKYSVKFYDGVKGTQTKDKIYAINVNAPLKEGDKVLAIWTQNTFYEGVIEKLTDKGAIVKWNDGGKPSEVTRQNIVKL